MSISPVQSLDARQIREQHEARIRQEGIEQGKQQTNAERDAAHASELGRIRQSQFQERALEREHGFWRGVALSGAIGLVMLVIGAYGGYSFTNSGMFSLVAADRARHDRWTPPPELTSTLPEQGAGYSNNPLNGRPLHEPADAP